VPTASETIAKAQAPGATNINSKYCKPQVISRNSATPCPNKEIRYALCVE